MFKCIKRFFIERLDVNFVILVILSYWYYFDDSRPKENCFLYVYVYFDCKIHLCFFVGDSRPFPRSKLTFKDKYGLHISFLI